MSGSGGGTTTTQKADPWKPAQRYISGEKGTPAVLPEAARIYQQQAQIGPYEGQLVARPSETTKQSQAMTLGLAPTAGQQGQAISQYATNVLGGQYLDVAQNQALQGYMNAATQPLQQQLMEDILPSISAGAIQAGAYGGSRQGIAEGKAISDYLQQALNTRAALAGQTYAQERQLQQQAPGLVQQGLQTQLLAPQLVGQVGQARTAEQQALLDEQYALYQMRQQQPWQAVGQYANLVLPAGGMGGTTTGVQQAAPNPLGGALGGAAAGASIGSVVPGVGTGVGAAIGGGLGLLSSYY